MSTADKKRILIVDDDEDIREIMTLALARFGYETEAAANGAEALDAVHHHEPSLVLLDVMMPVMSGAEFLAHLRADQRYRDLPVLLVTAVAKQAAMLSGAQGLVTKPVDLDDLVARIDHWVD